MFTKIYTNIHMFCCSIVSRLAEKMEKTSAANNTGRYW